VREADAVSEVVDAVGAEDSTGGEKGLVVLVGDGDDVDVFGADVEDVAAHNFVHLRPGFDLFLRTNENGVVVTVGDNDVVVDGEEFGNVDEVFDFVLVVFDYGEE